jgi:hypothetical protein
VLVVDLNVFLTTLLKIAGYVAIGAIIWLVAQKLEQRRTVMARMALRYGLAYTHRDPYNLAHLDFELFRRGNECAEVLAGRLRGRDVRLASFGYRDKQKDWYYGKYSFVLVSIPVPLPRMVLAHETPFSRWDEDTSFESAEFNRRFRVEVDDREFAYKLVDARMMAWLLDTANRYSFEVKRNWVLVYSKHLPSAQLPELLETGMEFVERIPRLVWADYAA